MRSDLTVAEQNQSVVRLKANSDTHHAAIAFVAALFAYSQAKAREQYPGQYADARPVNGTTANATRPQLLVAEKRTRTTIRELRD
jgi:hypothetical protein